MYLKFKVLINFLTLKTKKKLIETGDISRTKKPLVPSGVTPRIRCYPILRYLLNYN
jgi:hypothetical protein